MSETIEKPVAETRTPGLLPAPKFPEIDHRTIKLLVGLTAIFLAVVTGWLAEGGALQSISESYYAGHWSRAIFTGALFAISAFLLCYNGRSRGQMIASKVAAA